MLDHPFWTEVIREEESAKEEEREEEVYQEEVNSCEGFGSVSSRCVDLCVCVLFKSSLSYVNPLRATEMFQTPFKMMKYIEHHIKQATILPSKLCHFMAPQAHEHP